MKKLQHIIFLLLLSFPLLGQTGSLTGTVVGSDNTPLIGATVYVEGTVIGTITGLNGDYKLTNLEAGELSVSVSYLGYETASQSVIIAGGSQELNFTLNNLGFALESIVVTAQKRSEQIQDVPISISVLSKQRLEKLGTTQLDELSDFIPGLNIQVQSTQRPGYVIRGITSDGNDPNSQPRVSVYYDNIPINRASGAVVEPYDMERVEVVKGPQGTLFGRGAQIGAVHFIPQKPKNTFEAGVKAAYGSYNLTNLTGYVNTPLSQRAAFRLAGTFDRMDGFVKNTFGGNLNGKNTAAGRASLRLLPTDNFSINMMVDYQKDDAPGVAFVTKNLPNQRGEVGVFQEYASLEQGEDLETSKENTLASLTLKYQFNDNTSLTSISSYRWHEAFERYDGDGSAARTLDFSEANKANQFYQELRLNTRIGDRFTGVLGGSFFTEDVDREFVFQFDEQSVATFFFLRDPSKIVDEQGIPVVFTAIPPSVPGLGGAPLPTNHGETRFQNGVNTSVQGFIDGTYELTPKLSVTGGLRLIYDKISIREKNEFLAGSDSSVLGFLTGRAPNLFSPIQEFPRTESSSTAVTGRLVAKYAFNQDLNVYGSYSKGRRPQVIEFRDNGDTEILEAETVNSYELGIKSNIRNRATLGFATFFQDYSNFRTTAFINADSLTMGGTPEVFQSNAGEATAFGIEVDFTVALAEQVSLFGNYNYIKARFADEDSDGKVQEYAGNMFRLTPDHSFSAGLDLNFPVGNQMSLFLVPSYSFKSKHFFDDSNPVDEDNPDDAGLNNNQFQDAYGIMNINAGVNWASKGLKLTVFARNVLDEQYVIDAGNTGAAILGQATYVRGRPQIFGARVEYNFSNN